MTEDLLALGRRAVACSGWRWLPGMRLVGDDYCGTVFAGLRGNLVVGTKRVATLGADLLEMWPGPPAGAVPDLSDPATCGALLALVREAWNDPRAYVLTGSTDTWRVWVRVKELAGEGATEAESIVAAMESAP